MNSVGVWGEAWLTWKQGKPVLQLTAVSFAGAGGRRIVSPILTSSHFTDGKTEAREQLLLHRLTSLRLVPSQEAGAEGRGLVVVKDTVLELDDSLTR